MKYIIIIFFMIIAFSLSAKEKICISPDKAKSIVFMLEFMSNSINYQYESCLNYISVFAILCDKDNCSNTELFSKHNVNTIYLIHFKSYRIKKNTISFYVFDAVTGKYLDYISSIKFRSPLNDKISPVCDKFVD